MTLRSSNYKGDSYSKKLVRACHWLMAVEAMTDTKRREGPHLVLASRDAGDVAALLAIGAKPSSIIAVDHDPEATLAVLEQYPGVRAINDDIFDVAKHYKHKLATATLDFCNNVSKDIVDKASEVFLHMQDGGFWGLVFSYGREGERAKADLDQMRAQVTSWLCDDKSKNYRVITSAGDVIRTSELGERYNEAIGSIEGDTNSTRSFIVALYLSWRLTLMSQKNVKPCAGVLRQVLRYVSNTEFAKGMPMFLLDGSIYRPQIAESKHAFYDRLSREPTHPDVQTINVDKHEFRVFVVDSYDKFRVIMNHAQVAQLLNIPVELLNSWVGEQP